METQEIIGQNTKAKGIEVTPGKNGTIEEIVGGTTEKTQRGVSNRTGSALTGKIATTVAKQEGIREDQQAQSRSAETIEHD